MGATWQNHIGPSGVTDYADAVPIRRTLLTDTRIPPSAFRVACWVLTLTDGTTVSSRQLSIALGFTPSTVRKALRELEELGYAESESEVDGRRWWIYDFPASDA